ncbi:MAG: RsmE family RNA methyltransferase [Planctomycetota bacterium]|jgi:16S rRNA (uracil1498-N3)-methyltransferase|nr:RsmE family RNA methyltransferase [Planctomycetia bacterium]MDO7679249.1 16S rRNA (uracil(1498)-N(3))-methyltransferase [Pirellulales bacterium]RLS28869.1 MAG: 16S rRNA (uracil(1498)-N(3))-methyltransferase [Planctomycetota bacterium]
MIRRFFLANEPESGCAVLQGDEAHHLVRVLRAQIGDSVELFSGTGRRWMGRVTSLSRSEIVIAIESEPIEQPQPAVHVTLAVALPKGDRQKWLVEKLTELGVAELIPLEVDRGVAIPTDSARARLMRTVIESCKQCGRDRVMTISPSMSPSLLIAAQQDTLLWLASPDAATTPVSAPDSSPGKTRVLGVIGPEGGLTESELSLFLQAGFLGVSLGPHILRIETAAIAMAVKCLLPR